MCETIKASSKYTIKQIFKDNWNNFLNKHKSDIRPAVLENIEKIMNCGDKDKLGYNLYSCSLCGHIHYVAHTCKSRFCNSCGKIMTDKWMDKAQKDLLNVPYYHVVFSPPDELWLLFRS